MGVDVKNYHPLPLVIQTFPTIEMPDLRSISSSEIRKHNSPDDAWIVVNGSVYDTTEFAPQHPGGAESKSHRLYRM